MVLEIIFGCLAVTFGYTSFNLFRKVERLEAWVEEYADRVSSIKEQKMQSFVTIKKLVHI
jgi:hypothetical protein